MIQLVSDESLQQLGVYGSVSSQHHSILTVSEMEREEMGGEYRVVVVCKTCSQKLLMA